MLTKFVRRFKKVVNVMLGESAAPCVSDPVQLRIESFDKYMRTEVM